MGRIVFGSMPSSINSEIIQDRLYGIDRKKSVYQIIVRL